MKNGMQFTIWAETRKECEEWFRWFEGRNIPAAIVHTMFVDHTEDRFSVFRKGTVMRRDCRGDVCREIKVPESKIFANHEVVASCHGYTA